MDNRTHSTKAWTLSRIFTGLLVTAASLVAHQAMAAATCSELLSMSLTDARIDSAERIEEPVPHCKARGVIGGNIGFSIWLPTDNKWNGRFLMGGAGGFVGEEDNQALRFSGLDVLSRGFATASTDTGHKANGMDNRWGLNDWEAIANYAYLGVHRAATTSKAVIANFYGQAVQKSFFFGCSNGGRQALQEAQRYPHDFDGIIAGAPASNFTAVTASFLNITQHMFPDSTDLSHALVTPADRALLRTSIEAQCDARDGLTDGILQDPTTCDFDVSTLQCGAGKKDDCLSAAKVAAINAVYAGPEDTHGKLQFGFPLGAENIDANGWGSWLTGGVSAGSNSPVPNAAYAFSVGLMRNFIYHDAQWDYASYDLNHLRDDAVPAGALLNADNPDLTEFRAQGGKLLMFHGWSDVALSAHMTTDYVDRVYANDRTANADVRLFMMPGVLHCAGGNGPSVVDWVQALENWHDSGTAPAELTATYPDKDGARKLCAWPQQARYVSGAGDSPADFTCE